MIRIAQRDMDRPPGRPPLYPWHELQIGDTFFAAGKTPHGMQNCGREYRPMRFKCRSVVKNGVAGTRVWRIA